MFDKSVTLDVDLAIFKKKLEVEYLNCKYSGNQHNFNFKTNQLAFPKTKTDFERELKLILLRHSLISKYLQSIQIEPLSDMLNLVEKFRAKIPRLTSDLHKGQCGRIGVVGGSKE